jgi:hypothetical protein
MIETEKTDFEIEIENFLALEPTIFDEPESYQTLANVIDSFHKIASGVELYPVIMKETRENPYHMYRFEDPKEPNLKILIYTPVLSRKPTVEFMNNRNTRAVFKWPNFINMYAEILPLKEHQDKGEYLKVLQIAIEQKVEELEN